MQEENIFCKKVEGLEIEYYRKGSGKKLIFICGAWTSFRVYFHFLNQLSKNFEVIVPVMPGMGKSQSLGRENSFNLYCRIVEDFAKAEKEKLVIIGHSLGGSVAKKVVADNPEMFSKLILINSAGMPFKNYLFDSLRGWTHSAIEYIVSNRSGKVIPWDVYNMLIFRFREAVRVFRILKKVDLREVYSKIKIPVLLIAGKNDKYILPENSIEMNSLLTNSKLELIKNAGHNFLCYKPEMCMEIINNFIK